MSKVNSGTTVTGSGLRIATLILNEPTSSGTVLSSSLKPITNATKKKKFHTCIIRCISRVLSVIFILVVVMAP